MERKITPEYVFELIKNNYVIYDDFNKHDEDTVYDALNRIRELDDIDWKIDSGISKLVIIFNNQDFVIKIPFCGAYEMTCDCNNSNCEECDGDCDCCGKAIEEWYSFYGACPHFDDKQLKEDWDYCDLETAIYQKAKDMEIEFCLAETRFLGRINGHPVYTQVKADVYSSNWSTYSCRHSDEQKKAMRDYCHTHKKFCFNSNWLIDLRNAYGDKVFLTFMDFIEKTGVSDLHDGNVGYIGDCPVLIDYSDYNE